MDASDSFIQSFHQGLNLGHVIENDRRMGEMQKMQMQLQAQQLLNSQMEYGLKAKALQNEVDVARMFQSKPTVIPAQPERNLLEGIEGVTPEQQQRFGTLPAVPERTIEGNTILKTEMGRKENPELFSALISKGMLSQALKLPNKPSPFEKGINLTPGATFLYGDPNNPTKIQGEPKEAYQTGHIQPFDTGEGTTIYREYQGNGKWKDRPDLGGKTQTLKGYETPDEAFAEAQRMVAAAGKDAGLVPSFDLGPGNKYIPKALPNITLRIPPFTAAGANFFPGYVLNRKTGNYEWRGEGQAPGMSPQASLDWQALKKSALTINGPTFKRLIDNAEVLAVGVRDPKTGTMSKPELDQVADLRDKVSDKWFSKINSDIQAFNNWDQFIAYKISDPDVARLKSKIMANIDTLASIYSGGGTVTSDFKMQFAKDLFEAGLSKDTFRAKLETHKESVLDRARKYAEPNPAGMSGRTSINTPSPVPAPQGNYKSTLDSIFKRK